MKKRSLQLTIFYPALEKRGLQDKVKIVIWDHNRDLMFRRLNESMAYPGAREKVWGQRSIGMFQINQKFLQWFMKNFLRNIYYLQRAVLN